MSLGGTDDAYHTEWISAGITVGNTWGTIGEDTEQRLVGGTKTWRIGDGSIECTHHHWQVVGVAGIEEEIIACEHHTDIEEYRSRRQQVERHTAFLEAFEEARTYLQTDHKDKENESEVLYEGQNVLGRHR